MLGYFIILYNLYNVGKEVFGLRFQKYSMIRYEQHFVLLIHIALLIHDL